MRNYTIPRLELCDAELLFNASSQVVDELCTIYKITNIYAWTDSSVVFSWIQNTEKKYETFVQNRLSQIRTIQEQLNNKMNEKVNIKLISSKENPADIVSRGMKPSDLKNLDVWFYGPKFLNTNENK